MNTCGVIFAIGSLIGINMNAISNFYDCNNYYTSRTTTTKKSQNSCMFGLNYAQMGLAGVIFICSISFVIATKRMNFVRVGATSHH